MNEEQYKKKEQSQTQQIYIPAAVDASESFLPHMVRFPIALQETPDQVCGTAQRVGHVQIDGNKQVIYRLKLRMSFASRKTATLPNFFVLVNGAFVQYNSTPPEHTQDGQ